MSDRYDFGTVDRAKHVAGMLRDNEALWLHVRRRGSVLTIVVMGDDPFDRGYVMGVAHVLGAK